MSPNEYGPFANVIAIAGALIASFSMLLLNMLGRMAKWSWLADDSPPFLITAGARALTVALMAATYISINNSNYRWFLIPAVVFGLLGFAAIARFDYLRKVNVLKIPVVGADGQQATENGQLRFKTVVIGSEGEMKKDARKHYQAARKKHGGLSIPTFMSGYGSINHPEDLWERELLAKKSSNLTLTLMCVVLFAVMALFLAAFIIEASRHSV